MTSQRLSDWVGGKPAGCLHETEKWCQVLFAKSYGIKSKCFSYSKFESKEEALEEARKWQREQSNAHNLTKNMYRIVGDHLEVKLQNDLVMLCEIEHIPIVEERIWTANKSKGKYTYYTKSRDSKKRGQKHTLFHRRVYPEFPEVDHINRNGLDNRRCNIRNGKNYVNANNKRMQKNNTSGVKGVYKENGKKARWCSQWSVEGKKRKKTFSIAKYGEEEAFRLACEHRETVKFNTA